MCDESMFSDISRESVPDLLIEVGLLGSTVAVNGVKYFTHDYANHA